MKERPILFSDEMVRAILEGRKSQTRRVLKYQLPSGVEVKSVAPWADGLYRIEHTPDPLPGGGQIIAARVCCPYGVPGDRLWIRESWSCADPKREAEYPAAGEQDVYYRATESYPDQLRWRPSIHMPRWASRLILELTDVRVERLQEISEEDAKAEGVTLVCMKGWEESRKYRIRFHEVWDELNAKRGFGWARNPWVWILTFKRVEEGT